MQPLFVSRRSKKLSHLEAVNGIRGRIQAAIYVTVVS
jgi:hypothetical protein